MGGFLTPPPAPCANENEVPQFTWEGQPISPKGEVTDGLVDWSDPRAVGRAVVAATVEVVRRERLGGRLVRKRRI